MELDKFMFPMQESVAFVAEVDIYLDMFRVIIAGEQGKSEKFPDIPGIEK